MDFLAANYVRIVGLCKSVKNAKVHRADIFAIAQLSYSINDCVVVGLMLTCRLPVFVVEQNLVGISGLLCLSRSVSAYEYERRATGPLCENMTSSTKPEVHNVSQCRQCIGPSNGHRQRAQKFDEVRGQTDRKTHDNISAYFAGAK